MLRYCVVVLLALGCACAVVVKTSSCPGVSANICHVSEVRIEPCKEAPLPCKLKKRANSSIEFDFTPNFSASNLKTSAVWASGVEPKFGDLDDNGCLNTPCPLEAGKSQTYAYSLYLGKNLPKGTFPIKWALWNADDEEQKCCFQTTIKIS